MQNPIKILIDLKKENFRFGQAQQYDDVILDLTILENGLAKDLTGETVELLYINANNTVASVTGDKVVISGNNVKITCPRDCTRSYGIAKFQLRIVSAYQISTFPIALTIVPSVDQGQPVSQNISTILEQLTAKNIECGETLESLNTWVNTHGDIVNLDTRITSAESQLADIVHYNIVNYAGNSLNEKWDNMKSTFVSFQPKEILIPIPKANQEGAILTSKGWKWELTAPMIFTDICNCSKILIYDEIVSANNIDSAIRFDDALKPEDIDFPYGIRITGDSLNNKRIGIGLDIRASARLNFMGQVLINDCDYGVVIGGENQSAPSDASFDKLSIGFPSECGLIVHGKIIDATLKANEIVVQILQQTGKDAVKIMGKAIAVDVKSVTYNTDVAKNGYTAYDAQNVVHIIPTDNQQLRNIKIGDIFGSNAICGLKIDNPNAQTLKPRNIFIDNIRVTVDSGDTNAYDIDFCENVVINTIGEYNLGNVGSTANFTTLKRKPSINKVITDTSQKHVVNNMATKTNVGLYDLPTVSDFPLGTIITNITSAGSRIYLKYRETGVNGSDVISIDGQMFIPKITTLPTATWELRGKMYMVFNTGSVDDTIVICARRSTGVYAWRELITGTWI